MRPLIEPPPRLLCDHCHGELRLKQLIQSADGTLDLDTEIFVCVKCGHEHSWTVRHDHYAPHLKTR
jgi:hypothetical protein